MCSRSSLVTSASKDHLDDLIREQRGAGARM
jgi:hypothetical protein